MPAALALMIDEYAIFGPELRDRLPSFVGVSLSEHLVEIASHEGLHRISHDWHSEEVSIHLVFATNRGIVPAVRVLIDYLAEHFKFRNDDDLKKKKRETTRSERQKNKLVKAT